MMRATSKKTGVDANKPMPAIFHWFVLKLDEVESFEARASSAPEACRIAPNNAPSPMTVAMNPSVPPRPFANVSKACSGAMPAARALNMLTSSRAAKAFIRARNISASSAAMPNPVASRGR